MAPQVFLSFRELAALAPEAGLLCTLNYRQQLFLPFGSCDEQCPEIQDEEDQISAAETYAEWKHGVEKNPGAVNHPLTPSVWQTASKEDWFIDAIRKTNRT